MPALVSPEIATLLVHQTIQSPPKRQFSTNYQSVGNAKDP